MSEAAKKIEPEKSEASASSGADKEEFTSKDLKFSIVEEVTKTNVLDSVKTPESDSDKTATNTKTFHNASVEGLKPYPNQSAEGLVEAVDRAAEKILEAISERYECKIDELSREKELLKEEVQRLQKHLGLSPLKVEKTSVVNKASESKKKDYIPLKPRGVKEEVSGEALAQFKKVMHQVLQQHAQLKPDLAQLNRLMKDLSWEQFKIESQAIIKSMNKKVPESKQSMLELLRLVKK